MLGMEGDISKIHAVGSADSFDIPAIITAAHELKSPLALMRQLSLSLQAGECSSRDVEIIAQRITLTSERALRLTNDLTKAARLENSLFNLEPINPLNMLEDVAHELSPLYAAKGRKITVAARRYSLLAVANADLLRRILLNFADNALHYSAPETPVTLSASAMGAGERIRLSVRDFGPALPTNIWKTAGVVAQGVHSRPESSGLGIYIANQFAGHMGATVGVTRHRDGATFYVDLNASTQMRLL